MSTIARSKASMIAVVIGLGLASAGAYPVTNIATSNLQGLLGSSAQAVQAADVEFVDRAPGYIESTAAARGFREMDLDF